MIPGTDPMVSRTPPRSVKPSGALVITVSMGMFSMNERRISVWKPFMIARVMFRTITPMAMPITAVMLPRLRKRLCRRLRR